MLVREITRIRNEVSALADNSGTSGPRGARRLRRQQLERITCELSALIVEAEFFVRHCRYASSDEPDSGEEEKKQEDGGPAPAAQEGLIMVSDSDNEGAVAIDDEAKRSARESDSHGQEAPTNLSNGRSNSWVASAVGQHRVASTWLLRCRYNFQVRQIDKAGIAFVRAYCFFVAYIPSPVAVATISLILPKQQDSKNRMLIKV